MNTSLTPGSVVVGVDGSPHSDVAIEQAVAFAKAHRRPLAIVHAAGDTVLLESWVDRAEARRSVRAAGRKVSDHAVGRASKLAPDLDVSAHVMLGDARSVLMSATEDAFILFLGSRGRGTVASLLLGSVSVALTAHARCPVVVVRPTPDEPSEEERRPILVGVDDGDASSAAAIDFAFNLASWWGRPLEVVYAFWEGSTAYLDLLSEEQQRDLVNEQGRRIAESVAGYAEKYPDVMFTQRLVHGDAARALVRASEQASMVVVGSHGRTGASAMFLGSVSRSVVERAHCSVAVVKTAVAS